MAAKRKTVSFAGLSSKTSEITTFRGHAQPAKQRPFPGQVQSHFGTASESQSRVTDECLSSSGQASTSAADSSSRPTTSEESEMQVDTLSPVNSRSWNSGGSSKRSSGTAGDYDSAVSLLRGDASVAPANDQGRFPALVLGALCVFMMACAMVIVLDQKWNLFGGEGAPPFAEGAVGVAAAKLHAIVKGFLSGAPTANDTSKEGTISLSAASSGVRARKSGSNRSATSATRISAESNPMVAETYNSFEATEQTKVTHPAARKCRAPEFSVCVQPRPEAYYRPDVGACALSARVKAKAGLTTGRAFSAAALSGPLSLCNRSPNRFASLESCRRSCVEGPELAQTCFDKPLFAGCSSYLVQASWWFFDGHLCRPWGFLDGKCPSTGEPGGAPQVFRSRGQCLRQCAPHLVSVRPGGADEHRKLSVRRCRRPQGRDCSPLELRFRYFVDVSSSRDVPLRCVEVSPRTVLERRCLVGANRFRSLDQCRQTCVARRGRNQARP